MGQLQAKVENKDEIIKRLKRLSAENAKRVMKMTMNDMKRSGPALISKVAATTYAVAGTKMNPRTKAGAGRGSVSAGGSTLEGVEWEYSGERLTMGGTFKITPAAHRFTPYKIKGKILKGGGSPYGHWSRPYSEGGRYGAVSPWMMLPGINVPIQRTGQAFGGAAKGLSVPQMVLSDRTRDTLQEQLEIRALQRLEHYMDYLLE